MEYDYVDDLVEKYIGAILTARMWQTLASQYCAGGIPSPTIEAAHKRHQQNLEPLWSEYKKQRKLGNSPEVALQILLPKLSLS
jgi:hypothetical protein